MGTRPQGLNSRWALGAGALLGLLVGCGPSGVISYRNVDNVAGSTLSYGAAKNKSFSMLADTDKEMLNLHLFQQSECDVIKVKLVDRVRQTLQDGVVVHRDPPSRLQAVQGISGVVVCDATYARDVQVSLRIGSAVHALGTTSATGELRVNLAKVLKPGVYPNRDSEAEVVVDYRDAGHLRRASAGSFSLAQLNEREERLQRLVGDLENLLASPTLNEPANLLLAYKLYAELHELGTTDPRIAAVQLRFLELFFERSSVEAAARVKRNLAALKDAKDLLKSQALVVPPFVHASVFDDTPSTLALQWALGEATLLTKQMPALCEGVFTWKRFEGHNWPPHTRFVMSYLRYALGDGFGNQMVGACERASQF